MLQLTPKTKRNINRIIPFGLIWFILSLVFLFSEHAVSGAQGNTLDSAINVNLQVFIFASFGVTLVGLLVGVIELVYLEKHFVSYSFKAKIFYKFIIYTVFLSIIIFVMFMIAASIEMNTSIFDVQVWNKYVTFLFSITHLSTLMQIGFSLLISLLYAEVSENLGQNVLKNFFTGKYHNPINEERVIMFTDMKASTTIAEKLGNRKYFELLRAYYNDLSNAIINNEGEVYQYIGDEIVITWNLKKVKGADASIKCFYDMKTDLEKRKDWYHKTFHFFPEFKAAIHVGEVTTGEIGALKKEIFFTGDVLNTTARMQSLCNEFSTDLLVSQKVLDCIQEKSTFQFNSIGNIPLKGKQEKVSLFTVKIH